MVKDYKNYIIEIYDDGIDLYLLTLTNNHGYIYK
jgi:hypothetical protein